MSSEMPDDTKSSSPDRSRIVDEHFWITATTLAVNGFIISECLDLSPASLFWARIGATVISIFAVFLIVHRSSSDAGILKNWYPDRLRGLKREEKKFWHKAWETWCHVKLFPFHLVYVVCEASGALFYLLLVVLSVLGVWFAN